MRRQGLLWLWGWVLGMALLCLYIAFEVLDVDGSRAPRSAAALLAANVSAETDRLRDVSLPPPVRLPALVLAAEARLHRQPAATNSSAKRAAHALLRRHLDRIHARGTAPSADPA